MPAAKVTLAAPTTASMTNSEPSDGATAAARPNTPNARAASASTSGPTRRRVPTASAPPTAPTAMAEVSAAYVPAEPWNANRAIRGKIVWKLNDSVPTIAITPSGMLSSGVRLT